LPGSIDDEIERALAPEGESADDTIGAFGRAFLRIRRRQSKPVIDESDDPRWTFDGTALPSITFSDPAHQGKDVLEWVALKQELIGVVGDYNALLHVAELAGGHDRSLHGIDVRRAERVIAKAVKLLNEASEDTGKRTGRRAAEVRARLRDAEAALRLRSFAQNYKRNAAWMFFSHKQSWQEVALLADKAASMVYRPALWNLAYGPISEGTVTLLRAVIEKLDAARNPLNRNRRFLDKLRTDLQRFGSSLAHDLRGTQPERSLIPTVVGED
jgi:hypothetical protein